MASLLLQLNTWETSLGSLQKGHSSGIFRCANILVAVGHSLLVNLMVGIFLSSGSSLIDAEAVSQSMSSKVEVDMWQLLDRNDLKPR